MKVKTLFSLASALLMTDVTDVAKTYNKDDNKLDLYGKIDGLYYSSDDEGVDGDQTYMRVGVRGEIQTNDQLIDYGQWEHNVRANNTESSSNQAWTRLVLIGLKLGDAGFFDYDRSHGVVYDVTSRINILSEFGGDTYGSDNFLQSRANGVATHRNSNFLGPVDGLNFVLRYQSRDGNVSGEDAINNGCSVQKQNGDGYGISVTYDIFDGTSVGFVHSHSKHTDDQNNLVLGNGGNAKAYTGGSKYDANNVYLVAQYIQAHDVTRIGSLGFVNKAQNSEVVVQYQFDFGLRSFVAYLQSRGKDLEGYGDQNLPKYADVDATHHFNKNMSTHVSYKINLLDDNSFTRSAGVSIDDVVAPGLVYQS